MEDLDLNEKNKIIKRDAIQLIVIKDLITEASNDIRHVGRTLIIKTITDENLQSLKDEGLKIYEMDLGVNKGSYNISW